MKENMSKIDILKSISFGESVAELEAEKLQEYFIETYYWNQLKEGRVDIVYGLKGSGKSAIYSLVNSNEPELFQNNIIIKFAENPRGATAFSDLQADPPPSERSFISLWKLYLLSLLGEHINSFGATTKEGRDVIDSLKDSGFILETNPLKVFLGKATNYIKKYFNPESLMPNASFDEASGNLTGVGLKITFAEPSDDQAKRGVRSIDTLLNKANAELRENGFVVWFLLDRLDVAFAETHVLEENALRALFKTYLDLAGYDFIKLKIFLRTDIWKAITKAGFREATHIQRSTTLKWDRGSLLNLIIRRFVSNKSLVQYYNVDIDKIHNSQESQEALFFEIFPDKVDTGNNPVTLDWIIGRVQDSSGYSSPRDIIILVNCAISNQIHSLEIGDDSPDGCALFTRKCLKEALTMASKEKVEKFLYAEYPGLISYFKKLQGRKTRQTVETLAEIWSVSLIEAETIADAIADAGVWKKEGGDPPEYWTVFIFRDGLNLVQGTEEIH
jgi:hypothetical protein